MKHIKAAFFDFDWTLFDHKTRTLIDSAVKGIKQIQNKGIKVFINSARSYFSLASLNTFEKIKFDGFVVSNGGACFLDEKTLYANYLDQYIAKQIMKICDENNLSYLFSTLKDTFIKINGDKTHVDKFYSVFYEGYPKDINDYKNENILVLQCFCDSSMDYLFENIQHTFKNRFFESCVEFTSKEFIKSDGINAIIKEFDLKPEEICAFGDDLNDIDMFKLVKFGVCMGNGKEEAKKHAFHITSNIEDNGIYNGLKFLKLL